MSAENKAIVRSFLEVQDHEERIPAELCSPDFTAHLAGAPPMDLAAFEQFEAVFSAGFSNIRHSLEDIVAEGDRAAFRMTMDATHTGEFMGVPASGKQVSFLGIGIMRIADGNVADYWTSP